MVEASPPGRRYQGQSLRNVFAVECCSLILRQGIPGLTRAVIKEQPDGKKQLLVEGMGLREVMTTDGES